MNKLIFLLMNSYNNKGYISMDFQEYMLVVSSLIDLGLGLYDVMESDGCCYYHNVVIY